MGGKEKVTVIEVKEIVLRLGKREIRLTDDEARQLKRCLDNLYGASGTVFIPQPYPVYPPAYIPPRPLWYEVVYTTNTGAHREKVQVYAGDPSPSCGGGSWGGSSVSNVTS